MTRLTFVPILVLTAVMVAACGSSTSGALDTLPPIRTTTSSSTTSTTVDPRQRIYIVQSGDNVNAIARAYQVTATGIIELNNLPPDGEIHPGQELKIPNVVVDSTLPTPPSSADTG